MIVVIVVAVILILTFIAIFIVSNNRFNLAIIKIDKAEEDIDLYLQKKSELLDRTRPLIKKELKLDKTMPDLDIIRVDETNFETHLRLKKAYNEFFKTLDDNEKLLKSESLLNILDELNDNEENIIGAIKFYNDTVVEFNQLVVSFPSKIVALFKGYKKKEFYNNEKREIFQILNEK